MRIRLGRNHHWRSRHVLYDILCDAKDWQFCQQPTSLKRNPLTAWRRSAGKSMKKILRWSRKLGAFKGIKQTVNRKKLITRLNVYWGDFVTFNLLFATAFAGLWFIFCKPFGFLLWTNILSFLKNNLYFLYLMYVCSIYIVFCTC